MMSHQARFVHGQFDNPFGARSQGWFSKGWAFTSSHRSFYGPNDLIGFHPQFDQNFGGDAIFLFHEPEQEMLGTDVVMIKALRFFLRQL